MRFARLGWLAMFTLAAFALYANALRNPFISDDLLIITENPTVARPSAAALARLWITDYQQGIDEQGHVLRTGELAFSGSVYRPFATFTFWLSGVSSGLSPLAFRAVNVALHAGAAFAVALLAAEWAGPAAGLVAGAVAVLHPSATDVINRVVGRADILAVLGIAAFLAVQRRAQRSGWTWARTIAAASWAAVALGSKETGVVVIPLALVHEYLGRASGAESASARHAWRGVVALAGVAALYAVGRSIATGLAAFRPVATSDLSANPLLGRPLLERVPATAALALDYLRLLVVPWPLVAFDAADRVPLWSDPTTWVGVAVLLLLVVAAAALARRRSVLALPVWWWLLTFLVFAQLLFPLVDYRQLRFVYALVPALALGLAFAYERLHTRAPRIALATVAAAVACVAAIVIVARNRDFTSLRALLDADLRARPNNAAILMRSTDLDADEGRLAGVEAAMARVTELAPSASQGWYDRGSFYDQIGRRDLARSFYERALAANPANYLAAMRLGTLTMDAGDLAGAERLLEQARRAAPDDPHVGYNLAVLATHRGDVQGAITRLRELRARYPGFALARQGLEALGAAE